MRVELDAGGVVQLVIRAREAVQVGRDGRVKVVAHFRTPDLLEALRENGSIESMDGEMGFPPVRLSIDRGEVHHTPIWLRDPAPGFRGSVVSHAFGILDQPVRRVTPIELSMGVGAVRGWEGIAAGADQRRLWHGEPVEPVPAKQAPRAAAPEETDQRRPTEHDRPWLSRRGDWWAVDLTRWGGKRRTMRDPGDAEWPTRGRRTRDRDEAERWWLEYVRRFEEVKGSRTARDVHVDGSRERERVYPSPLSRPERGRPWRHRGMILNADRRLLVRRVRPVRGKAVRRRLGIFRSWRDLERAVWDGRLWVAVEAQREEREAPAATEPKIARSGNPTEFTLPCPSSAESR